ncbi:hypothetical protein O181_082604, partial [Austropuccinia psidii MF-1]|nr:hypothetical protein [Austropuccinia psidii MF-1]
ISTFEPISSTNPEGFHQAQVYERDPQTGKFRDEDIAKLLKDSTHEVAGAFGARGVPAVLKWVDCQGMRTARDVWRVCTLNELRTSLGLKVFETFEEWNSNPEIASAMEELVGHPSNIPLYVGLHGEEAKEPRLGAGLCPGFTISRAILSDAVSLVRGDRFFTDSATADGMTDWGLSDCQVDVREGSYGGLLQRLISYNLPNQYRYNDVALLFPFMVPEKIYQILMDISPVKACNYSLKSLPAKSLGFTHHQASDGRVLIKEISDTESVQIERIEELFGIQNSRSNISTVFDSLFTIVHGNEWKTFEKFISERILQCAVQRSSRTNDLTVDICRDVINPLITGWLAHMFGLVETGLHSQHLLLTALSDVYLYLTEPEMTYKGRTAARIAASGLAWQIKYHIEAAIAPTSFKKLFKKGAAILTVGALNALEDTIKFASGQPVLQHVHQDCCRFYSILVTQNARENKLTSDELAADCFRAVATLAYSLTHGAAHALDHLIPSSNSTSGLESSASTHLVQSLENLNISFKEDKSKFEQVAFRANYSRHGLEATRLNHWDPKLQGFINERNTKDKREGRTIGIIDNKWDLSRDYKEYFKMLDSNGNCLRFYEEVIGVIVKEVTSLPNVRKSPGLQGTLTKVHILDSVSGMPTMHIRFNKDQSSTET